MCLHLNDLVVLLEIILKLPCLYFFSSCYTFARIPDSVKCHSMLSLARLLAQLSYFSPFYKSSPGVNKLGKRFVGRRRIIFLSESEVVPGPEIAKLPRSSLGAHEIIVVASLVSSPQQHRIAVCADNIGLFGKVLDCLSICKIMVCALRTTSQLTVNEI